MNKVLFSISVVLLMYVLVANVNDTHRDKKEDAIRNSKSDSKTPPCLQMYYSIEKYADSFDIPKKYAYGIAFHESRYQGPFHWDYKPGLSSSAGAVGPMQIMLRTAHGLNKDNVTLERLKHDIDYNVMTSMKLMRKLKNKRGSWGLALGEYNTGKVCVNGYAKSIINHKINWKNYE